MSNELEGTMNEPTDLDLVDLAKAGDIEAFTRLARRYQKRIYRTVLSMVRNHEDADDLAQDAFLQAFKSIDKFKKESGFYTWIYRIAVNVTLNHLKKRAKEKNHEEFDPEKAVRTGSFDALGQSPEKNPSAESWVKNFRKPSIRSLWLTGHLLFLLSSKTCPMVRPPMSSAVRKIPYPGGCTKRGKCFNRSSNPIWRKADDMQTV